MDRSSKISRQRCLAPLPSDACAHLPVLPQDYANKLSQHYRSRDASLLDDMPPLGSAGAPFAPTGKSNHKQDPLGTV